MNNQVSLYEITKTVVPTPIGGWESSQYRGSGAAVPITLFAKTVICQHT